MNLSGVILGAASFAIIGIWHPIVIKGEYYLGKKKCVPLFVVIGLIFTLLSVFVIKNAIVSACFALFGFSAFWGIKEVYEQEERVKKGWFPKNPNRKD